MSKINEDFDAKDLASKLISVQPMVNAHWVYPMYIKAGWKHDLEVIWLKLNGMYANSEPPAFRVMNAIAAMQEKYPGEYILVEAYDEKLKRVRYKLEFATPEDESLFLIKYSES